MKPTPSTTIRIKTPRKGNELAKQDAFTALCRSELGLECVKELQFHPERRWRFDYAIPSCKVALEVEGGVYTHGRHTRPVGFLRDMEKYNTAAVLGWTVVRTTPLELYTCKTLDMLKILCESRV